MHAPHENGHSVRVVESWSERIDRVDWASFRQEFQCGTVLRPEWIVSGARARDRLLELRSGVHQASEAARALHSDLCYSAIRVHSAAVPALPFLIEVLDEEPPLVLTEDILDIILGLSLATNCVAVPDWVSGLRAQLQQLEPKLRVLASHPEGQVPSLARHALRALDHPYPDE